MVQPARRDIIGFSYDAFIIRASEDFEILELGINESLWWAKSWLNSRGLNLALEKIKVLLVKDRRSYQYPRIFLGEHEVVQNKSIKYLGVQLDSELSSGEHLQITPDKAIQWGTDLAQLMPNMGGPREAKRKLVAQRSIAMRIISAYRTVSMMTLWFLLWSSENRIVNIDFSQIFNIFQNQVYNFASVVFPQNLRLYSSK